MDIENQGDHLFVDGREGHDFGEACEELGPEVCLHDFEHVVVCGDGVFPESVEYVLAADVGCEYDECVGEVTDASQPVVELAFVEYLEEEVEY